MFRVRSQNSGICIMLCYVLRNLWHGWIVLWDISCPGGSSPKSGPLSLTCGIITMLGVPLGIDTKQICFHRYTFPWLCVWEGCIIILYHLPLRTLHQDQHIPHTSLPTHGECIPKEGGVISQSTLKPGQQGQLDWSRVFPLLFRWIRGYLAFISTVQSMMCAKGRIYKGLMVVSCFSHATPSHYHQNAGLHTCIIHTYGERSSGVGKCLLVIFIKSISRICLVLLVTLTFLAIYGVACVHRTPSSLSDREDIFVTNLIIIIKLEVWTLSTVVVFFGGCVSVVDVVWWQLFHTYPRRVGLYFHYYCAVYYIIPVYEIVGFACVWSCVHDHTCWSC